MVAEHFRRLASLVRGTPLHPQWLLGRASMLEPAIRGLAAGRILDIGCANRWVESLLQPDLQYVGLDYPATGGAMYGARPDVFADASKLPIADASMDAVVMLEVLEHLKDPTAALAEAARVLRSGGRLFLSIPFLYPIHDSPHDYQRLTLHGLRRDVEAAGLRLGRCDPSLGSAETAGLLMALAMGGMAVEALHRRTPGILLIPLVTVLIPVVNLLSWLAGRVMPDWPALTAGYTVEASRT